MLIFLGAFAELRKRLSALSCVPVRMSAWNWAPTGLIFIKLCLEYFFRKYVEKTQGSLKSDKNNGYFTWRRVCTFITSRRVLLRMRNLSNKSCRETQKIRFMFNNSPPPHENRAVYGIMKNMVEPDDYNTAHAPCWIIKATNTFRVCNTYCF